MVGVRPSNNIKTCTFNNRIAIGKMAFFMAICNKHLPRFLFARRNFDRHESNFMATQSECCGAPKFIALRSRIWRKRVRCQRELLLFLAIRFVRHTHTQTHIPNRLVVIQERCEEISMTFGFCVTVPCFFRMLMHRNFSFITMITLYEKPQIDTRQSADDQQSFRSLPPAPSFGCRRHPLYAN